MSSHFSTILLAADGGSGGAIIQLLILLLIPFAMYFFMIRPQRRRVREQRELQQSIQVGDEVVTTSGIHGKITGEDGDTRFWLEIDDDVQIRIARAAIQGKAAEEIGAGNADEDEDEDDEVDDVGDNDELDDDQAND